MTNVPMASAGESAELPATHKGSESPNAGSDDPVQENGDESEESSSSRSEGEVAYSALEIEADAFTRFIERQRMDVMFELHRLRLGKRPITGQPNLRTNRNISEQPTRKSTRDTSAIHATCRAECSHR